MGVKVAITGTTGNMGREALNFLCASSNVDKVYFLCLPSEVKTCKKLAKKHANKAQMVVGDVTDFDSCRKLVADCNYVVHMAAVIPPHSDRHPELSDAVNFYGTKNIVDAISQMDVQPKLVHISTVAVYGNRNYLHPFGRVGDPLLPSVFDPYAMSKLEGERYVLESGLKRWAVIRQTAMLHNNMLSANLSDGLMFHTCFNAPLEWVTARDSGRLIGNIVDADSQQEVSAFWLNVFNLGGGIKNRNTGYEVFDGGFKIIGGSTHQFMQPNWNALRNFHGMWFYDSQVLEDLFHFRRETVDDYWKEIARNHKYYKLGSILPAKLISALAIKPLLKYKNSPTFWEKSGEQCKVQAYFGDNLSPSRISTDWKDFPLLCKGQLPDGGSIDYQQLKQDNNAVLLSHGYDESKSDSQLTLDDLRQAAQFRGGQLVSQTFDGDMHKKLVWQCHDGHRFEMTPFSVLKAGHWCPECIKRYVWDYDRLALNNPFYAQVLYDSFGKENYKYWLDEKFQPHYERKK